MALKQKKRQEEKFGRLAKYSLDEGNRQVYKKKEEIFKRARFKTDNIGSKEYAESKRPLADFRAVPQDQVVELMQRDADAWIETLTDEEKKAIRKYTYNSGDKKSNRFFERLNAMLRGELRQAISRN